MLTNDVFGLLNSVWKPTRYESSTLYVPNDLPRNASDVTVLTDRMRLR